MKIPALRRLDRVSAPAPGSTCNARALASATYYPDPWIALPRMNTLLDCATAETRVPSSKRPRAIKNTRSFGKAPNRRPKIGWRQQHVRRYAEPYHPTSVRAENSLATVASAVAARGDERSGDVVSICELRWPVAGGDGLGRWIWTR